MNITKFGLSNFRVFKDHFDFDLAPIMVLTGPNNSGKSSLTKALLLIKENESEINKELHFELKLNFFQGGHDLGNYKLTRNSADDITVFSFMFFNKYKFQVVIGAKGKFLYDYVIVNENNELVISQSEEYITIYVQNIIQYFLERVGTIIKGELPDISSKVEEINVTKIISLIANLFEFGQKYGKIDVCINIGRNSDEKIAEDLENCVLTSLLDIDPTLGLIDESDYQLQLIMLFKVITSVELSKAEISFLVPPSTTYKSDWNFFEFSKLIYINALKENLKRTYTKDDNSVFKSFIFSEINKERKKEWVEPDQLFNLDIKSKIEDSFKGELFYDFIYKWLNEFNLGANLSYGYNEKNENYFIKIDRKSLLDYGFGSSSILHILLALRDAENDLNKKNSIDIEPEYFKLIFPPTYIIEEPETGLHPAFQSKMAEMLVDIQKTFNVNLIIETHSEYFIRKLQYLTARNEVNSGDVVIYYFNNPKKVPENEPQIKRITILKDGSLSDNFGPGFIDEGFNLKFELLRLNKSQNN